MTDPSIALAPLSLMDGKLLLIVTPLNSRSIDLKSDELSTTLRTIETIANPDGSATSHVVVKCTLVDIARATNLRLEDAAFALNECGLLVKRYKEADKTEGVEEVIMISREMVEVVAEERMVKRTCMDLAHVLL